jgi:hypothetical protein
VLPVGEHDPRVPSGERRGEHPVGQGLQDDRSAGQLGGVLDDLLRRGPVDAAAGEQLVEPLGGLQLGVGARHDRGVHALGDRDERHLDGQSDHRQADPVRRGEQRGWRGDPPLAELHQQAAGPGAVEVGDVAPQLVVAGRQRDAGGQHQLAAAQQALDLAQLQDVHPADGSRQTRPAGEDDRLAGLDLRQGEHVGDGGRDVHAHLLRGPEAQDVRSVPALLTGWRLSRRAVARSMGA